MIKSNAETSLNVPWLFVKQSMDVLNFKPLVRKLFICMCTHIRNINVLVKLTMIKLKFTQKLMNRVEFVNTSILIN